MVMVINGAQLHFLFNHIPVVGMLLMIPAMIVAMRVDSLDIKKFVLISVMAIGLSTPIALWTGEPAEDTLKKATQVDEKLIEVHEDAADMATMMCVFTAVLAFAAYMIQRRHPDSFRKSLPVVLFFVILSATAMGKTAHEGGKIRHPEIENLK